MLDAERETNPPFYFRRVWSGQGHPDDEMDVHTVLPDGTFEIRIGVRRGDLPAQLAAESVSLAPDGLVIYGRRVRPIPADWQIVADWERNGQVYSECFSVVCVDGEVGTHPRSEIEEITREEFEAAKARGWS